MKNCINFIRFIAVFLAAIMLLSMFGCDMSLIGKDRDDDTSERSSDKDKKGALSTKKAEKAYESFMDALTAGDLDKVNKMLPMGTQLYGGTYGESSINGGFLSDVFATVTYTVEEKSNTEDGQVLIKLKIENVDLKALLLSLPEDISSKEEAKAKMKELLPTAVRKTFDAEVFVRANGKESEPEIIVTPSLANALTGGLNDILSEIIAEEMINETTN